MTPADHEVADYVASPSGYSDGVHACEWCCPEPEAMPAVGGPTRIEGEMAEDPGETGLPLTAAITETWT